MKPEIDYLLFAEYHSISPGNKLNILGIFYEIRLIESRPFTMSFSIAGRLLNVEAGTHSLKIVLCEPETGNEVAVINPKDQESLGKPISMGFKFNLVEFSKIGRYELKFFLDGEEMTHGKYGIEVKNNEKSTK